MIFMLAGAATVDIVRVVGLLRTEESVLRKELENARMIAISATNAVNVLVDIKAVDVTVDECCSGSVAVVADIRKRGSCQLGDVNGLYTN